MLPLSILQFFWPSLSDNLSWKPIFGLFESGCFTQILCIHLAIEGRDLTLSKPQNQIRFIGSFKFLLGIGLEEKYSLIANFLILQFFFTWFFDIQVTWSYIKWLNWCQKQEASIKIAAVILFCKHTVMLILHTEYGSVLRTFQHVL